jgi:hypothetical protein
VVYFEDVGTVYEASLDELWKYLGSEEHGGAHVGNARNFQVKETSGNTTVISAERNLTGQWMAMLSKSTEFPPFCICYEEIEGLFAGTKFVALYRPKGGSTQVDVFGDIQSRTLPIGEAKTLFLASLVGAYADDAKALKTFLKRG